MKRTRSISLVPYPPRVRRVSRYELQKLFPKYRSSRVSSQQSFDINLQSSQAKNWSLSFNESNFIHQEHPHSNEKRESVSKKLKLRSKLFLTWCTTVSVTTALILLGSIIGTHQHQLVQVALHQQRVVLAVRVPHLQPAQRVLQPLRQPLLQQKQLQHQVQVLHHRRVQVCL
ncbi:unnamed protein product [Rotaria socialis]